MLWILSIGLIGWMFLSLFVLYVITSRREREKIEQEREAWKMAMKRKLFNAKHGKKSKRNEQKGKPGRIINVAQANHHAKQGRHQNNNNCNGIVTSIGDNNCNGIVTSIGDN